MKESDYKSSEGFSKVLENISLATICKMVNDNNSAKKFDKVSKKLLSDILEDNFIYVLKQVVSMKKIIKPLGSSNVSI